MPISAAEAESLLGDGEYVHNMVQSGMLLLGCDFERPEAIKAFRAAQHIEIGGEHCKRMGHPLAVWDDRGRLSFFAADAEKVAAFEAARLGPLPERDSSRDALKSGERTS